MQTLLVAEDDLVMHDALAELLRTEGYEVVAGRCVRDCARLMESCAIDAALVDWVLAGETSEALLDDLAARGVTIILLSGHPEARVVADRLGIPCVHKPFVVEQLLGILSGAISRRTLRRIAVSRAPG